MTCTLGFPGRHRFPSFVPVTMLFLLLVLPSNAAIRSWTGSATSGYWSANLNWAPPSAPQSGDDLIFPAGLPAADRLSTNDLSNLRLTSITFNGGGGGYFLRGNAITLTNNVSASQTLGANTIEFDIALGRSQSFWVTDAESVLNITGDIQLGGFELACYGLGTNNLSGVISGTGSLRLGGNVFLNGTNGPNTFNGVTRVVDSTLYLARYVVVNPSPLAVAGGVSVPHDLIIESHGEVIVTVPNQIADSATVQTEDGANFRLNGVSEGVSSLLMSGGTILTVGGTLTNGNITADTTTSLIQGSLHLGAVTRTFHTDNGAIQLVANVAGGSTGTGASQIFAGIIKTGNGSLRLSGNNTFGGPVIVEDGTVRAVSDTSFGPPQGGVVVNRGQVLLEDAQIGNETLTINYPSPAPSLRGGGGVNTWGGLIILNTNATFLQGDPGTFNLNNVISGPSSLNLIGGTFRMAGAANTYTGATTVESGTLLLAKAGGGAIQGPLVVGDGEGGSQADIVRLQGVDQIQGNAQVTIHESGLLDGAGFSESLGPLTINGGQIDTGTPPGTFNLSGIVDVYPRPPQLSSSIRGRVMVSAPTLIYVYSNFTGKADLQLDAQVIGAGGLYIKGGGLLHLSASNTYSGLTTLEEGELLVSHSSALGSTNGRFNAYSGSRLILSNSQLSQVRFGFSPPGFGLRGPIQLVSESGTNALIGEISIVEDVHAVVNGGSLFRFLGPVSGTSPLIKSDPGALALGGLLPNDYAGTTTVLGGELRLEKPSGVVAVAGRLVIGDDIGGPAADRVRLFQNQQILDTSQVTVNSSGLLDLNGFAETVGQVTLQGGDIAIGSSGVLTPRDVTVNLSPLSTARITAGQLHLAATQVIDITGNDVTSPELFIGSTITGPGGFIKNGPGELALGGANTYAGLTTVNAGQLTLTTDSALGSTLGGTTVRSNGVLAFGFNVNVGQESLALNSVGQAGLGSLLVVDGSNSWAGPIVLETNATIRVDAGDYLNLTAVISGPGRLNKEGAGTLLFTGGPSNTYTNLTTVEDGLLVLARTSLVSVPGDLFIGDGIGTALSAGVRLDVANQIFNNADVIVLGDGWLDLNDFPDAIGSLAGIGRVDLGSGSLFTGQNNATSSYDGTIVGLGALTKRGTGTMLLGANNTYSGLTTVEGGILLVHGSQPQSVVQVNAAATLGGRGTVGHVNVIGGTLAPGSSPAILTTSNVTLNAASTLAVEINGPRPASGYDQLNVRGTIALGGATLARSFSPGYLPSEGETITLLSNDGTDPVTGTFAGLADGALLSANQLQWRLNYNAGSGNDVVLTATNIALRLSGDPAVSTGNGVDQIEPGECNHLNVALVSRVAGIVSGVTASLSCTNAGVTITQPDSAYPDLPALGTRFNTTPFQISTAPSLICGTNIDLLLTVHTATNGNFNVPFTVYAGAGGLPVRFDNGTDLTLVDAGSVDSVINVAGFDGVLVQVSVSLHLSHTADGDLDLSLVAPDGTIVELSSDNGGTADDYGTSEADADRTYFNDLAATSITTAQAPFRGAFIPEQPLARLRGKYGAAVNGAWRLRIADDAAGGLGTLRVWSLVLVPAACRPGGGECERCGGPIAGAIGAGDRTQNNRLLLTGNPSECASADACPGLSSQGTIRYDAYVFTNAGPGSCVSVQLDSPCSATANRISSAAYLGTYNTANLCSGFLGQLGSSPPTQTSYSFQVPSESVFVVIVNETTAGGGCSSYSLNVTGFDCPQWLEMAPLSGNRVKLVWSTSAGGYQLMQGDAVQNPPGITTPVVAEPIVTSGKYVVTNSTTRPRQFYELRKQ